MDIPVVEMDLDLDVYDRYDKFLSTPFEKKYVNQFDLADEYSILPFLMASILRVRDKLNDALSFKSVVSYLALFATMNTSISKEFQAITNVVNKHMADNQINAKELTVAEMALAQIVYESSALCTSVVIDREGSSPIHFRTMDWDTTFLDQVTVQVEYMKGNRPLFHSTSFVGYVGSFTGMSTKGFSISVNYRKVNHSPLGLVKKMALNGGSYFVGQLVLEVLENAQNYEEAVELLKRQPLISPAYFTISGKGEGQGAVITRGENTYSIRTLSNYLVQTNEDYEKLGSPHSANLFQSYERVQLVDDELRRQESLSKFNVLESWKTLSKTPVMNGITRHGVVMIPGKDYYRSKFPMDYSFV